MKKLLILLGFILCISLSAQETSKDSVETRWNMFKYDIATMFQGVGYSYTRPLHWEGNQWAQFGAVVGGTALVYLADDDTSRFIRNNREGVPQVIRDYGEFYGSPSNNYMATSGVYAVGLITKNEKLRRTGVLLISSATSAGLLQQVLKSVVGRARPLADLGKDTFDPFNSSRNFHSFPSGHALLAFTNAYAIGKQFKSPWVKAGIYTLGAIPGISRVWDGQHWLSDMVFAFAISIATVESIDRYLDKKYDQKYNDQKKLVSWNLNFGPGTMGVTVNF
ncbi:MAG: phosphatase PAP2 family protein [Maribacter dokdonensis]|uniref:phosphatase PAP2 family protein n=1 Tax=Maribacter TaxID=252356 RepID=UPI001AFE2EF5|nr:phosphatase PAP2 family protein [Maribacter dokdonensis]MDP2525862.1 phosphatase PAP2 family protein [Maribacter dokdonensis]CAG2534562.1 Membrane-associated phospholipid phosphatase [Maribacter dokdonensis]